MQSSQSVDAVYTNSVWVRGPSCESLEGVRLPRDRGKPLGRSREHPGKWGSLAKFPGNLWIALQVHSERSFGEVAEKLLGKFGENLGSPGTFQKLARA